jgi:hypothetical protein
MFHTRPEVRWRLASRAVPPHPLVVVAAPALPPSLSRAPKLCISGISRPTWWIACALFRSLLLLVRGMKNAMVTVARGIEFAPRAHSFTISLPTPIRALIASCCNCLRPRLYEALVAATAAIIVCIAIMMPTSNSVHLHKPLGLPAAAIKNFGLASHAYIECSLASAGRLSFQLEIAELVAIAAIKQCADKGKHLRELAVPMVGEGGSLHIMLEVDDLIRGYVRSIVAEVREETD